MAKIILTSAAKADLADIWSYIAVANAAAADKLLAQIDVAFDLISRTPEIGFPVDEIKPGLRCKPVKRNYLIFYRIIGDDVFIVHVLHGSRKHEDLL